MTWCAAARCLSLTLVVGCAAVPAPDLSPPGPRSAAIALSRAVPGQEVRLHLREGDEIRGRLRFRAADSAGIVTPLGLRVVALAAVDTVWRHRDGGRLAGQGVLYGVAAGAALAVLLISADCHGCDDPGLGRALAPYSFVLAAAVGSLMGSIGAATAPEWVRTFPAPRPPRPW
jgi:hypothetical protein